MLDRYIFKTVKHISIPESKKQLRGGFNLNKFLHTSAETHVCTYTPRTASCGVFHGRAKAFLLPGLTDKFPVWEKVGREHSWDKPVATYRAPLCSRVKKPQSLLLRD